jgi:3-hydroxymyristoyl/3-hydroxydecanoyl-(acyl carrier protein) dehydratase
MTISESHASVSARQKPLYSRTDLEGMFLPAHQMLQLDRVLSIEGLFARSEMDVTAHWAFPMHFPQDPIFPGTLLIEAAGQALAVIAWHLGVRGRPRLVKVSAKFEQPVFPQDGTICFKTSARRRNNVFLGKVDIGVGERAIAVVEPVLIIVPH